MSKKCLKKSLGVIKQQDEKQQSPYESIANLLQPESLRGEQNFQSTVLKQLDNFHKFYNKRYEESKENYDRINQLNWEYAGKIVKYEQLLQNYQLMQHESKRLTNFMSQKFKQLQMQTEINTKELERQLKIKDQQINELKSQLIGIKHKNQMSKKKIVRLKDRSIKIQHDELLNIESARSNRHLSVLKNEKEICQNQIEELSRENDSLTRKIKHLQADRKYQNQRLKNATLALQLDLKIKNQQIQRLNNQIQIYQKKFQELIKTFRNNNYLNLSHKSKISYGEQKCETLDTHFYEFCHQNQGENNSLDEREGEKTERKYDMQVTEKKSKHKRYGSLNLEQMNRKQNEKQDLNMKIKIFKYSKNKKCV